MEQKNTLKKLPRGFYVVMVLVLLSITVQGFRGIWETDEGRYTNVALEMLRYHEWIHPMLQHEMPHYTKPPMTYWLIAASVKILGRSEWAARLPSNLAFYLTIGLLFFYGRFFLSEKPWLAALVYGTSLMPLGGRFVISTDMILACFETLAMVNFIAAFSSQPGPARKIFTIAGWVGFGLAFLTKGPPGILPLLALIVFAFAARKKYGMSWLFSFAGIALFFVIAGSWFAAVIIDRPELLHYFWHDEVVGRIATNKFHRNSQWYGAIRVYVPALIFGTLPWTIVFIRRLGRIREIFSGTFWKRLKQDAPEKFLVALWILIPLVVFFIAKSRLTLYVLPLFTPISILCAMWLEKDFVLDKRFTVLLCAWMIFIIAVYAGSGFIYHKRDSRALSRLLRKLHPGPLKEVIFAGRSPYYGLNFYLNAEVERIPHNLNKKQHLMWFLDEINEKEEPRLWIVSPGLMPLFETACRKMGVGYRILGRYRKSVILELSSLKKNNGKSNVLLG